MLFSSFGLSCFGCHQLEFKGRDIISIEDFSQQEINHILDVSKTMEPLAKYGSDMLKGKILATLFFEPSTRTRLSFETAMLKLGGNYIGFAEPDITSDSQRRKPRRHRAHSRKLCRCNCTSAQFRRLSEIGGRVLQSSNY